MGTICQTTSQSKTFHFEFSVELSYKFDINGKRAWDGQTGKVNLFDNRVQEILRSEKQSLGEFADVSRCTPRILRSAIMGYGGKKRMQRLVLENKTMALVFTVLITSIHLSHHVKIELSFYLQFFEVWT